MDRSNTGSGQHIRAVVARPTLGRTDLYGGVAPTCTAGSHRPVRRGRTDLYGGVAPTCPQVRGRTCAGVSVRWP